MVQTRRTGALCNIQVTTYTVASRMHDMQGMVYSFPIPHIMMNAWLLRLAGSLMLYVLQSCMLYYSPANVSTVFIRWLALPINSIHVCPANMHVFLIPHAKANVHMLHHMCVRISILTCTHMYTRHSKCADML